MRGTAGAVSPRGASLFSERAERNQSKLMFTQLSSCVKVEIPRPTKSPLASIVEPVGYSVSLTRACHSNVQRIRQFPPGIQIERSTKAVFTWCSDQCYP